MSITAVSVGTSATELVAENFKRVGLIIENVDGAPLYFGDSNSVTTSNGLSLAATNQYKEFPATESGAFYYKGPYFGIVASGTADVRVLELETTR